ncbi:MULTISPECIES: hypothetical protein [unclassified Acinetobacter]|uniref:hypothetical protein n=1 Tax=unclassified Acinetobacter TaxID=196816 RepID=UPI0013EEBEF4|nr:MULTISPECIES: hypothetical protein [unclassified Acinetobacter]
MIDVCDVCGTNSDNCIHFESMMVCDVCSDDFECMSKHSDVCAELDDEFSEEEEG